MNITQEDHGTNLSSYCKECSNVQTLTRQRNLKKDAINYKGGKCVSCGYNKCQGALEFHHIDPNEKDFTIAHVRHTSFEKIKEELDKCILLCSNCHREIHSYLIKYDEITKSIVQNVTETVSWKHPENIISKNIDVVKIKERLVNKESISDIAKDHNISKNYLLKLLTDNNIYISKIPEQIKTKITWPSVKQMKKLVWELSALQLSKKLGVSDVAVNKFCKKHNIEKPPKGYWAKKI